MRIGLSANLHIEMAVPDVPQAYAFLHDAFGAQKIEQEVVARISFPDFMEIQHVGMGEVVLQFCRPSPRARWPVGAEATVLAPDIPHSGYLAQRGPCLSNLTYCVDDISNAKAVLAREGIVPALEIPMGVMGLRGAISTPGKEPPPGYYFSAMDALGFDLEFTEGVPRPGVGPTPMYPAFTHPRPMFNERVARLLRVTVAVSDIEQPLALLNRLFGTEAVRSSVGSDSGGGAARAASVTLGNLPVQYCTPGGREGPLRDFIAQQGKGVYRLVFGVNRIDATVDAIATRCRTLAPGTLVPAAASSARRYVMRSRSVLGFDIELEEMQRDK